MRLAVKWISGVLLSVVSAGAAFAWMSGDAPSKLEIEPPPLYLLFLGAWCIGFLLWDGASHDWLRGRAAAGKPISRWGLLHTSALPVAAAVLLVGVAVADPWIGFSLGEAFLLRRAGLLSAVCWWAGAHLLLLELNILLHEVGHITLAHWVGLRPKQLLSGGLRLDWTEGRARVGLNLSMVSLLGGFVSAGPKGDGRGLRRRLVLLALGGMLASLLAAGLCVLLASTFDRSNLTRGREVLFQLLLLAGVISAFDVVGYFWSSRHTLDGHLVDRELVAGVLAGDRRVLSGWVAAFVVEARDRGLRISESGVELAMLASFRAEPGEPRNEFDLWLVEDALERGAWDEARPLLREALREPAILARDVRPSFLVQGACLAALVDREPETARRAIASPEQPWMAHYFRIAEACVHAVEGRSDEAVAALNAWLQWVSEDPSASYVKAGKRWIMELLAKEIGADIQARIAPAVTDAVVPQRTRDG